MELLDKSARIIPSVISASGYALVHDGIDRGITTPLGLTEVGVGRVFDLGDGFIARRYGLSTKIGALVDALLDKKASQEILDAVSEEGLIPKFIEDGIANTNKANALLNGLAKVAHPKRDLSPSREGKRFMFGSGINMGAYALAETVKEKHPRASKVIRGLGHAAGVVGVFYYGTQATDGYARRII